MSAAAVVAPGRGRVLGPISVSVCNYNGAEHLLPCLDALFALEHPVDEVLVVDNDSTDDGLALVRARYPAASYPSLRIIETGENRGPCPARNLGLREARNDWVLLVDNDAVLVPDSLTRLVAALEERSDAVLAQPRSVFADDPTRVHYDGGALHYVGLFGLENFYRPLAEARGTDPGTGVREAQGAVSVALLVDRRAVLESGGFDEDYFILFEDLDLSLRLRMRGHALLSVEEAICLHRGGTAGISFRSGSDYPRRRALQHSRNRWLLLAKNYRLRTLLVALPGLLAYELVWALFTLRAGTFGAYWRGKREFLHCLPRARRLRRDVQAARKLPDRELLVGGPLTIAPHLERELLPRTLLRLLDAALRAWWFVARPFAG